VRKKVIKEKPVKPKKKDLPKPKKRNLFEERLRLIMIFLREFEVMDNKDIKKYLNFTSPNSQVSFLRACRIKLEGFKKYPAKYKSNLGEWIIKDIYYLDEMTDQKLMLIGKKYTND
jgi:hypothetical protein